MLHCNEKYNLVQKEQTGQFPNSLDVRYSKTSENRNIADR